jgi:hypothetical protein
VVVSVVGTGYRCIQPAGWSHRAGTVRLGKRPSPAEPGRAAGKRPRKTPDLVVEIRPLIVGKVGRQCGVTAYLHRFRHHFSHTWLDRGGTERDLMELNG